MVLYGVNLKAIVCDCWTIFELTRQKQCLLILWAIYVGKHTNFICQIPKLTPFWWESSIWNTSHQHHSWHSRVKLITSDTCASSQSGRLICIEEHSAEVIDAHTKYGHPMTLAPISKSLPRPQSPDGSAMHGGTNTGSESKSDCNKTQKHEWEALQWWAGCRTMGPTLNKRQVPGWAVGVWYRLQAPTPCLGNRGDEEKGTQYCNLTADVFI